MIALHTLSTDFKFSKHFSDCAATFISTKTTRADGCKGVSFGENSFLVCLILNSNHTHICTTIMNGQVIQHGVVTVTNKSDQIRSDKYYD